MAVTNPMMIFFFGSIIGALLTGAFVGPFIKHYQSVQTGAIFAIILSVAISLVITIFGVLII